MHELGVTFYVIRDVKEVAINNHIDRINSVTLEIGEVSGIIHEQLQDCWKWAIKKEPIVENAKLVILTVPAITYCEDCHQEYKTIKYGKTCPHCHSKNTYLVQGNEFTIKEIEVYDEDS